MESKAPGALVGLDITVPNATELRDFYNAVFGWEPRGVDMGGYEDYEMAVGGTNDPAAGICHTRGENADLPPVWMPYFAVTDIDAAIATVRANGGETITPVKGDPGSWRYCVVRDPAGAHVALMQIGD